MNKLNILNKRGLKMTNSTNSNPSIETGLPQRIVIVLGTPVKRDVRSTALVLVNEFGLPDASLTNIVNVRLTQFLVNKTKKALEVRFIGYTKNTELNTICGNDLTESDLQPDYFKKHICNLTDEQIKKFKNLPVDDINARKVFLKQFFYSDEVQEAGGVDDMPAFDWITYEVNNVGRCLAVTSSMLDAKKYITEL